MVTIESSIGSSSFEQPGGRVFQVPDGSAVGPKDAMNFRSQFMNQGQPQFVPDPSIVSPDMYEYRMAQAKAEEATRQAQLADAKRRVEILTGLGRTTKEVKIETEKGPVTFTLRSLKGREQKELEQIFENAKRISGTDDLNNITQSSLMDIKVCTLKHGIQYIDGTDIDIVLGVYNMSLNERMSMRQAFIEELDNGLTTHLFLSFQAMAFENRERFAIKNEQDAKEVAELIKKSSAGT